MTGIRPGELVKRIEALRPRAGAVVLVPVEPAASHLRREAIRLYLEQQFEGIRFVLHDLGGDVLTLYVEPLDVPVVPDVAVRPTYEPLVTLVEPEPERPSGLAAFVRRVKQWIGKTR